MTVTPGGGSIFNRWQGVSFGAALTESPGNLACKAPRGASASALTSAALHDFVVLRPARAEVG